MAKHHDDEILGKAYDSKLMRRLLSYVKPYKKYVVMAILFNVLVAGLGPAAPLFNLKLRLTTILRTAITTV